MRARGPAFPTSAARWAPPASLRLCCKCVVSEHRVPDADTERSHQRGVAGAGDFWGGNPLSRDATMAMNAALPSRMGRPMNRHDDDRIPRPLLALLCLCITLVLMPGTAVLPLVAAGLGSALVASRALFGHRRRGYVRMASSASSPALPRARQNRDKFLTTNDLQWYKEARLNNARCAARAVGSAKAMRCPARRRPVAGQR